MVWMVLATVLISPNPTSILPDCNPTWRSEYGKSVDAVEIPFDSPMWRSVSIRCGGRVRARFLISDLRIDLKRIERLAGLLRTQQATNQQTFRLLYATTKTKPLLQYFSLGYTSKHAAKFSAHSFGTDRGLEPNEKGCRWKGELSAERPWCEPPGSVGFASPEEENPFEPSTRLPTKARANGSH